ncbi:MAG TPA: LLM class flavin-dependent oxidoreductase, partial [Thermomicrobiales bacterium]|nr:LLM class flavin-dependent oxidoreductase [Thermomicrobiales bacterium]
MTPHPLRFSLVLGQRLPWPILLANAVATEAWGFDGLFLVDHFFGRLDVLEPTHEGYTMLAAIAAHTNRVRLGLMVAGNTYRNPVLLLKQAVAVDHISRGRVDFGVGAGWAECEHEAYGFDLGSPRERVDRFAEALAVWDQLQAKDRATFLGKHYQIIDAPFEPKSVQGRLPVLIGGSKPRMLQLVAQYADIWNSTAPLAEAGSINQRLTEICDEIGRDPDSIERSISPDQNLLESVDAFGERTAQYHAAGFTHITLPWPRVDSEVDVLQDVAALKLHEYRPNPPAPDPVELLGEIASTASGLTTYGFPHTRPVDWSSVRAQLQAHPRWPLLAQLVARPGEIVDAETLMEGSNLARHREV